MAWKAPEIKELCLGMEINSYYPADYEDDDGVLFVEAE